MEASVWGTDDWGSLLQRGVPVTRVLTSPLPWMEPASPLVTHAILPRSVPTAGMTWRLVFLWLLPDKPPDVLDALAPRWGPQLSLCLVLGNLFYRILSSLGPPGLVSRRPS